MDITRRDWLHGMAALPLCSFWNWPVRPKDDRALIVLWLDGGMSHLDTFDCKPEATPDIRGDLKSRATPLDGVFFSEHLPQLAALVPKLCLFRSITHGEGNHDRASAYMLTGNRPRPVLDYPSIPAVHALGAADAGLPESAMPAFVAIPDAPPHGGRGYLPAERGPFELESAPGRPGFAVKDLDPHAANDRRVDLLKQLDALDGAPRSAEEQARDTFLARARRLSLDAEARAVFDLDRERPEVRQRYGRHQMGQSLLLARRLVEHGTRSVLVRDRGWDHHNNIKRALTYGFPPKFNAMDQAISALVEDLERRQLDDRVMLVVASEFGRTPRLNPAGGRDHWPRSQAVLAFGAGLKRGVAIGATDRKGEAPERDAMSPADFHATVVAALGGDVKRVLQTRDGRPVPVIERGGHPVRAALG